MKAVKRKILCYILIIGGLIGLIASFALTYDKIQILSDPTYHPGCSINPILSCGSMMSSEQASLLGVPNTIFGIAGYSALITLGVILLAGVTVKRWLWLALQAGVTVAVLFVHYLFFQGVFRINAICPWCFAVWMSTIPVFWYTTVYNLRAKNFVLPGKAGKWIGKQIVAHHGNILLAWYLAIFAILLQHFWYYWETLI